MACAWRSTCLFLLAAPHRSACVHPSTLFSHCGLLGARAGDPPQAAGGAAGPTFNTEIAPIIFEHCTPCHRPGGGGPFNLLTYEDARRRATQIALSTRKPVHATWKPEPGYGEFVGNRRLLDDEITQIQRWADNGAPQGDRDHLQQPPSENGGWRLGPPDLVVAMTEPYLLDGSGPDVFRAVVIPIGTSIGRYVKGLEFHLADPKVVHHANIKIDRTRSSRRLDGEIRGLASDGGGGPEAVFPDGHFLGWTPGQSPHLLPEGMAWRLEPNSDFVIELHMKPSGKPERVEARLGLYFTDDPPSRSPYMLRLGSQSIDIPAGENQYVVTDSYVLPVDVEGLSVQPHAHYLAKEVRGAAQLFPMER